MQRRLLCIEGICQGVGLRGYSARLAKRLGLAGFAKNLTDTVQVEIEGDVAALDDFQRTLLENPPPLAHIFAIRSEARPPLGEQEFQIEGSQTTTSLETYVSPDVATCEECLREMRDPVNRRFQHAFANCVDCGPRLTVVTQLPYDRTNISMASFAMCTACLKEYSDPADRRFHAQAICCPDCGPTLQLLAADGRSVETDDPVRDFAQAIRTGRIGAIKGVGGYHLVCDARNGAAVLELRQRKHREEKPLAIMVRDLKQAAEFCESNVAETRLLSSVAAPIVLLLKQTKCPIAESVAPGNPFLGVMLAYSPLHHLLMHALDGVPLVVTSANGPDEPIVYLDDDATHRLRGIADTFLVHDRPIHAHCDDSVMRVVDGEHMPLRRSRGYAPLPITLPISCESPILAVGGQWKTTIALGRDCRAILSPHIGDLDQLQGYRAYERDIAFYENLLRIRPDRIAHDLHPDYASTRYALERAVAGVELVAVQHHHAHMASCMSENGIIDPVIGIIFDGTGYGADGTVWGGEFLVGDYRQFRRAGHLRNIAMPGGERAIREIWRMAMAHLIDAGADCSLLEPRIAPDTLWAVHRALQRQLYTPTTSSMGRLFDAVASVAGIRDQVNYEGQAAIELEWLATGAEPAGEYPFEITVEGNSATVVPTIVVDSRPLLMKVVEDVHRGVASKLIARRFHSTIVEFTAAVCDRISAATGISSVVLSGGVFMNALLTSEIDARLTNKGFHVYRHRRVPPNDGGISLGQVVVAAAQG